FAPLAGTAAASERDRLAAACAPAGDAAVQDRARRDARRREHARRDGGARAGLADRHHGPLPGEAVLRRGPHDAIRDVAAAGDVAGVALVLLADVHERDLVAGEQALELVELHG